MKIRPVGAEFIRANGHADWQRGMTELSDTFYGYANPPKKGSRLMKAYVKWE
jgi:hypothetical protein